MICEKRSMKSTGSAQAGIVNRVVYCFVFLFIQYKGIFNLVIAISIDYSSAMRNTECMGRIGFDFGFDSNDSILTTLYHTFCFIHSKCPKVASVKVSK